MSLVNLTNLYNAKEFQVLQAEFKKLSDDELKTLLKNFECDALNEESLIFAKIIMSMHQSNLVKDKIIYQFYEAGINQLKKDNMSQKLNMELLCILSNEISKLNSLALVNLSQLLLETLKVGNIGFGSCFKIFQKLIDILPQHTTITGCGLTTTGVDYRKTVLERICLSDWHSDIRIHIINMLRDFSLTAVELDLVTKKITSELGLVSLQELPPFIFQILAFANSYHKSPVILPAIVHSVNNLKDGRNHICSQDNNSYAVCGTQGTILLYVANSIKQNLSLGRSLLKMLKNVKINFKDKSLSPFFLAICVLLVQDGRFTEDALSSLRTLIIKYFQDTHKRNCYKYIQEYTDEFQNIQEMLCTVAKNSANGWSCVVSGLVQLGFSLIEVFGPKKTLFGKISSKDISKSTNPHTLASKLGLTVVSMVFKGSKLMRSEIIKVIVKYIRSNLINLTGHYLKLFASITKSYPQSALHSLQQIKILLDDLPLMGLYDAQKLYLALLPLLKVCPDLRTSLILTLRKMLSSRVVSIRECALCGFLFLLNNFLVLEMSTLSQLSSQSSQSIFSSASIQGTMQHSPPGQAYNRMLCMEVLHILKKCLFQQYNVRILLYKGFSKIAVTNPQLSSTIVELLFEHLLFYYENNTDIIPPISFKACISKIDKNTQEPFPLLLATISAIVKNANNCMNSDDDMIFDEELIRKFNDVINSIFSRLCKCEVDDFLEIPADETRTGSANIPILTLCLLQVLIEHWMIQDDDEKAIETYQNYKKLYEQFSQRKFINFEKYLSESLFMSSTFSITAKTVSFILSDSNKWTTNENFTKHIMLMLHNVLTQASEHGFGSDIDDFSKQSIFDNLVSISQLCFHKFLTEKNMPDQCTLLFQCINCFHLAAKIIFTWYSRRLVEFYSLVNNRETLQSQANTLVKVINQIQRSIIVLLSKVDPLTSYEKKLLSELLALLETLFYSALICCEYISLLPSADWFQKVCLEYQIEDNFSTKRVTHLFLISYLHLSNHPVLPIRDLASDIRINLESDEEVGSQPTYKIVSSINYQILVPVLVKHLDHVICDCDWLLGYLKACCLSSSINDPDEAFDECRRKAEGMVCGRICTIAVGLLELVTASIEVIPAVESVIIGLTSFFNFLIQLSKYYMWMCSQTIGTIPSRFEKLISFIGSELMRPIYAFIMHAESVQSNCLNNKSHSKKVSVSVTGRAKILRESKSISQLVFSIEQHEHQLILLARKSKIELMKDYHLSTARDFRIRTDAIQASLTEKEIQKSKKSGNYYDNDEVDAADDDDEEKENQDEHISASKRSRLGNEI